VNATIDGVVLDPSAFSMTFAFFPSMTATHEFVVPKSMPMTSFEYERIFAESPCAIDGSTCCDERIDDDDDAVAARLEICIFKKKKKKKEDEKVSAIILRATTTTKTETRDERPTGFACSNDPPKNGKKKEPQNQARAWAPSIGNFLFQFPSIPSAQHDTFGKREREQKKKKLKTKITHQRGGGVVRELARDAKHFVFLCFVLISVSRVFLYSSDVPKNRSKLLSGKTKRPKNDERHPSTFSSSEFCNFG